MAHTVEWEESWVVFYRKLLLGICKLDLETVEKANSPSPYQERVYLCSEIKLAIIHGDFWDGNMGINMETGNSLLLDVGSYYAHNKMELGHWRCEFSSHFRAKTYTRHYLRNYPAAEPADEFDDRNRLYSLKGAVNYSAGHPGSILRKIAYNNMCYLCERYAPIDGIDEYDPRIDPSITGATIVPHVLEGFI